MRLVLDTNVYLAALIARGACREVLEHCGLQHTLVVSDFILDELQDRLRVKFCWPSADVARAVALVKARSVLVMPAELAVPACRDRDDDAVLGTALAGNAIAILTGDGDLLELDGYAGLRILAPAQFWAFEYSIGAE